jgi:hypothetical protein
MEERDNVQTNMANQVRIFLRKKRSEWLPATWPEFHQLYPSIPWGTFNQESYKWGFRLGSVEDKDWFNNVRLGKAPNAEFVRRYCEWQRYAWKPALWLDFHARCPKISRSTFKETMRVWGLEHSSDPLDIKWFKEIRKGISDREQVRRFMDWQRSAQKPAR